MYKSSIRARDVDLLPLDCSTHRRSRLTPLTILQLDKNVTIYIYAQHVNLKR